MPLKLHVGLTKKLGLPNYSSVGATCQLEVELAGDLLLQDPEALQEQVQQAYGACQQAVQTELNRQVDGAARAHISTPLPQATDLTPVEPVRRATPAQVRAVQVLAERQQLDLERFLRERFEVTTVTALTLSQASALIDELKSQQHFAAEALGRLGR